MEERSHIITIRLPRIFARLTSRPVAAVGGVATGALVLGAIALSGSAVALAGTPTYGPYGPNAPAATCAPDGQCFADVPSSNPFYTNINSLYQADVISGYPCGGVGEPCDIYNRPYYRPGLSVTRQQMSKYVDLARKQPGIFINTTTAGQPLYSRTTVNNGQAIYGEATAGDGLAGESGGVAKSGVFGHNSAGGYGVFGSSGGEGVHGESSGSNGVAGRTSANNFSGVFGQNFNSGYGVFGVSQGEGVHGESSAGNGVSGKSTSAISSGVYGLNTAGGFGIAGRTAGTGVFAAVFGENTGSGYAGWFAGNVKITGTCCGASEGVFQIDHPQDPANKYLNQSAVASPDMKNIYDGVVTTGADGNATVVLPSYVEALDGNFRYQLTVIGQFAQAIVSSEIKGDQFSIKTDKPDVKVSWQVTGIRQDPYAVQNPVTVEQDKPANERGTYLHPGLYGQPDTKRVDYVTQP